MEKLNKYEMSYLESQHIPRWRNPETKKYEEYPLTPERIALLDSFIVIEEDHFLEMDNHGLNIHLFAYRETQDGPLLGFLFAQSSEETFYGNDYFGEKDLGPFEVNRKEVMTYEYSKKDSSNWLS